MKELTNLNQYSPFSVFYSTLERLQMDTGKHQKKRWILEQYGLNKIQIYFL